MKFTMRNHRRNLFGTAALATLAAGLTTMPALAQQGAQAPNQRLAIEEIVVTAKQRQENLQDVPLSITAFTGEALQERGILDVRDVARFTPSLSYYSGSGRADPTALVVRGVSPQTSDERYQGLSIFVDGMFLSGQLTSIDLSQVERVEVILGPQSATYGRATYTGAIDYITKNPSGDAINGRVRLQLATNEFDNFSYNTSLYLNVPVIKDKLWASLNGTLLQRGARSKNPYDGSPIGRERTRAAGGTIYATPSEGISIKARFGFDFDRDSIPLVHIQEPAEWRAAGTQLASFPLVGAVGTRVWPVGPVPAPTLGVTGGNEFLVAGRPAKGGRDRDRRFASLIATAEVLNGHEISYRGGYMYEKYWANTDFFYRSGVNDPFFGNVTNQKARQLAGTANATERASNVANNVANQELFENMSHELRLVSPSDQRFRYRAGLYYTKEWDINYRVPQLATAINTLGRTRGSEYLENYAAFAGVDVDVIDDLTVSAEGRISRETVGQKPCPATFCAGAGATATAALIENKESFFTPRVTVKYALTDENNIYAQWARGYKAARLNTATGLPVAEPEKLDNYEIGSKNRFFDGRVQLNIAGYYIKVRNQQLLVNFQFNPLPAPLSAGSFNVSDSRVYGLEVQGMVVLAEGWNLGGAVGYTDHKFTRLSPNARLDLVADAYLANPGFTNVGRTSINSPKLTGSAYMDYTFPVLNGDYDMTVRGDFTYRGKSYVDPANQAWIKGAGRFNARATLKSEAWDVAVFVNDVFNVKTALGAGLTGSSACLYARNFAIANAANDQRCLFLGIPRGREIGIEAVLNF
jgi:outer membrane receptor protein involved in Fe transport